MITLLEHREAQPNEVLYFCFGFRELSHLTHDLYQAEKKKINYFHLK